MNFIDMVYNNFFCSNLLITPFFNSLLKSFIVKSFPGPNTFLDLIALSAAKSYGVLTLKHFNHLSSACNFLLFIS